MMLIFVSFLCIVYNVNAQVNKYNFSHLDISDGLSHNQVRCTIKDKEGFLWFGTMSGLNRYDGYSFKVYKNDPENPLSLHDNYVDQLHIDALGRIWVKSNTRYSIFDSKTETFIRDEIISNDNLKLTIDEINYVFTDNKGYTWFATDNGGIYITNFEKNNLIRIKHKDNDKYSISTNSVTSIVQDTKGNIWLIHNNGILEKINYSNKSVVWRENFIAENNNFNISSYRLYIDSDDDVWIYSNNNAFGIYYFSNETKTPVHFHSASSKYNLKSDITLAITEDNSGKMWIGTDHGGINVIDKHNLSTDFILQEAENERSLSQNSITSLYKDDKGIIWVGTFKKGINYYHENLFRFQHVRNYTSDPNSLPYNDINCFTEDEKGNLWIGTNGGGLIYYNRLNQTFTAYKHIPDDPNSLSKNVIVSLLYDSKQRLWIGTYYGGLNYFDGEKFKHYFSNENDETSLSDNRVWEIYEDSKGNIWLGLLGGGLDLFDPDKGIFTNINTLNKSKLDSKYIVSITKDTEGDLWLGSDNGVYEYNIQTGKIINYKYDEKNPASLSNNSVFKVYFDSREQLWIGTRDGLNLFQPDSSFRRFTLKDGLSDNSVLTILEDNSGNLWMGTSNGLCNIQVSKDSSSEEYVYNFKNYDESDGLQGNAFYEKSAFKTSQDELIFGGANGFNIFNPERITSEDIFPKVMLVDFLIFNKSVSVNEEIDGRIILDESITTTNLIKLKYKENIIAIEFSALDYLDPHNTIFRYKLEGFNDNWMYTDGKNRRVTFTNLNPGKYCFKVQASKDYYNWNNEVARVELVVKPPFWRSYLALLFYSVLIIGALLFARRLVQIRERLRFQNEEAKNEAKRQQELNLLKTKFFTNVSHEFRTPLTLILSPLERIIKSGTDTSTNKQLKLVYTNAKRLLYLVNQLIDFRRMEVQQLNLNPEYGDVISYVRNLFNSFIDIAESKKIEYEFNTNTDELYMQFDHDKLEKIFFNLISNAFKYTHEGDTISLEIQIKKESNEELLEIKIKDTGIGIAPENIDKVFERFFQDKFASKIISQGSGIGLSLTKEFVKLHNGEITVESALNKGSCFTVKIPVNRNNVKISDNYDPEIKSDAINIHTHKELSDETILIAEDNDDFRFYLRDNLGMRYKIIEAVNGKDGMEKTLTFLPDLIVSDLKMPEVNGIAFCNLVKNDKRTSHIPFILLTASTTEQHKLESYKSGADDYITKPFSFEILESRILNLIRQRRRIRETFQKHFEISPGEITITSIDEKLINKALKYVEDNIADSDLSVERLSKVLGISRVHLYKKMISITGKKPVEFIRIIRLRRAEQLLKKSQLNVSEIAYQVGFNDPRYFSKMFKEEYKMLPSKYKQING